MWRKSAFRTVSVLDCDNERIIGIKITVSNRQRVIFSVNMPVNCSRNIPLFTEHLGAIQSIVEEQQIGGVEAFYVIFISLD